MIGGKLTTSALGKLALADVTLGVGTKVTTLVTKTIAASFTKRLGKPAVEAFQRSLTSGKFKFLMQDVKLGGKVGVQLVDKTPVGTVVKAAEIQAAARLENNLLNVKSNGGLEIQASIPLKNNGFGSVNPTGVASEAKNAAASKGNLIPLTNAEGEAGILSSRKLIGNRGIFAVPESVAAESTAMKVARTGLMPGETTTFVRVPEAATGLFKQPVPVGPYSAWKYFGGVRYAPPGSINMTTGALAPGSSLLGPRTLIYGPDVLFWGGVGTAVGIYLYGEPQQGGK